MTLQRQNFSNLDDFPEKNLGSLYFYQYLTELPQKSFYCRFGKRAFDIFVVLLLAPIAVPVVLILAALVARDGRAPFYSQERIGKDGRIFTMWKLRTMVIDAEKQLQKHLESNSDAQRQWNENQKLVDDPRVTQFGRIIRKTSMDELPQLWNVLVGDMSLVGPRPMMPEQRRIYPGQAYFFLRPGVSGFWQISDRHETTFAARAEFDDDYFREVSLLTDLKTLMCTVSVVFRGTGC